jgi:magnesium-transporting ATPase (P-type)
VDGTVLEASGLELDEALLTGEAKPVPKRPGDTVLSGSAVAAGAGRILADRVARRVLALQLPPAGILVATAGVVLAAILALTLWRRRDCSGDV